METRPFLQPKSENSLSTQLCKIINDTIEQCKAITQKETMTFEALFSSNGLSTLRKSLYASDGLDDVRRIIDKLNEKYAILNALVLEYEEDRKNQLDEKSLYDIYEFKKNSLEITSAEYMRLRRAFAQAKVDGVQEILWRDSVPESSVTDKEHDKKNKKNILRRFSFKHHSKEKSKNKAHETDINQPSAVKSVSQPLKNINKQYQKELNAARQQYEMAKKDFLSIKEIINALSTITSQEIRFLFSEVHVVMIHLNAVVKKLSDDHQIDVDSQLKLLRLSHIVNRAREEMSDLIERLTCKHQERKEIFAQPASSSLPSSSVSRSAIQRSNSFFNQRKNETTNDVTKRLSLPSTSIFKW